MASLPHCPSDGPTAERWFARTFGGDASRGPGSGWISGLPAVALGALGLGAVVVLHFPGGLSTPELRGAYPLDVVRASIELVIGLAFLSACASLLLRRKKALGYAGIALSAAATLAAWLDRVAPGHPALSSLASRRVAAGPRFRRTLSVARQALRHVPSARPRLAAGTRRPGPRGTCASSLIHSRADAREAPSSGRTRTGLKQGFPWSQRSNP